MHAFPVLNLTQLHAPDGGLPGIPGGGPSGGSGLPGIPGGGPSGIPGSSSSNPTPAPAPAQSGWGAPAPMPGEQSGGGGGAFQPQFTQPEPQHTGGGGEVFELAGWGARFAAWLLDVVFMCVLLIPLVLIAGVIGIDTGNSESSGTSGSFSAADGQVLSLLLIWLLAVLLYAPTTMAAMQGSTPGKRVMGIRVVRADGQPVTFGFAFVREVLVKGLLLQAVSTVTFGLVALINYLWPLWDSENRALHDFVARSRVVRR